jgi:ethanolamine-phosphate cytidylyltransferase
MPLTYDPYIAAREMGIYTEIGRHEYAEVNAGTIVQRILKSRAMYEERQRVKGVKGIGEEAQRRRERMEEAQRMKESKAS